VSLMSGHDMVDPKSVPGTCRRCSAFRYEARWCDRCGLDFHPEAPRPPDAASYAALQREHRWLSETSPAPVSEVDAHLAPPPPAGVTVVRFGDGSLVVPARVSTRDGQVGDGVTRIRPGHPRYDAWLSYCTRHPEHVVERRRQGAGINEHLEPGWFWL
jgi:hypothetical protein